MFTSTRTLRMPASAAASTVSAESTAMVTSASSDAIARSRAASTVSLASNRSSPRPAAAMPTTSRGVAHVNPTCPAAACTAANAVHLCAFTCGRNDAPGRRAAMLAMLRSSAAASITRAGVGRSSMCMVRVPSFEVDDEQDATPKRVLFGHVRQRTSRLRRTAVAADPARSCRRPVDGIAIARRLVTTVAVLAVIGTRGRPGARAASRHQVSRRVGSARATAPTSPR